MINGGPPLFSEKLGPWSAKYEIWGSANFCTEKLGRG